MEGRTPSTSTSDQQALSLTRLAQNSSNAPESRRAPYVTFTKNKRNVDSVFPTTSLYCGWFLSVSFALKVVVASLCMWLSLQDKRDFMLVPVGGGPKSGSGSRHWTSHDLEQRAPASRTRVPTLPRPWACRPWQGLLCASALSPPPEKSSPRAPLCPPSWAAAGAGVAASLPVFSAVSASGTAARRELSPPPPCRLFSLGLRPRLCGLWAPHLRVFGQRLCWCWASRGLPSRGGPMPASGGPQLWDQPLPRAAPGVAFVDCGSRHLTQVHRGHRGASGCGQEGAEPREPASPQGPGQGSGEPKSPNL